MTQEAKIVFKGVNQDLVDKIKQLEKTNEKLTSSFRTQGKVAKQTHNEEIKLSREAAKALEKTLTPLQRLKQEREKLRKQLTLGIVTEKQFKQIQNQLNQEFREAKTNTAAYREEQRRLNEEKRKGVEVTRSMETAEERYKRKVRELRVQLKAEAISQDTFNRAVRRGRTEMNATKTSLLSTSGAVGKLASAFGAFIGVQAILSGVRSELGKLKQVADDARLKNLDFAGTLAQTRNAFVGDQTLSSDQLESRILQGAKASRTSPKIFAAALQDVFSAKGEATNEQAVQATEAAFRLNPGDLESGRTIAARSLDVRAATGSTDFEANIGFLQNVQQNSRVTDLAQVGQNLVPAIASLTAFGDTPEQAAEVTATLNTLLQDAEGRRTRTTAISLGAQLRKFKGTKDLGSTSERLAFLQQNPEQARKFLEKASFEQASSAFVENLVLGDPRALAVQADKQAKIRPLNAAQAQTVKQQIADKERSPRAQLLVQDQASRVQEEIDKIGNLQGANQGQARDILDRTLSSVNLAGIDAIEEAQAKIAFELRTSLGANPAKAAADVLGENRAGQDAAGLDLMNRQIEILREIANKQQENNQLLRQQNNRPQPAAAAPQHPAAALGN